MSSQSSSGSRGIKRARSVTTKTDGPASIKEEPPKKVKKKLKSSSTSSMSLVLTKTSGVTSTSRKPSTDSPMTEAPKHPPVTTLGSLPLHGEELMSGGYNDIPDSTKHTCDHIRDVLTKIKDIKEDKDSETEPAAHKQSGLVLFSYLKKLNRLSHLYCKDSREQTHEQKLEVDDLHLQLQNLMYEAMHLRKEITNCLEFKSQHEDIDLVSDEEMYTNAPETISKPEVSRSDEHQRMLSRLQWEMEERKRVTPFVPSLESKLRSFACLTKGDTVGIEYNSKIYELLVLDTQPEEAVSIIECDMKVDFAAPVGYKSPEPQRMQTDTDGTGDDATDAERETRIKEAIEKQGKFKAFGGGGQRLDGKTKNKAGSSTQEEQDERPARGIPNYHYKKGKITFEKAKNLNTNPEEPMDESGQDDFVAFGGEGQHLRTKKNKNKSKKSNR